jgi:uncharacterized protein
MTDNELLDTIVERIREAAQPDQIILFGSRARGSARANSDYDLLVVKKSDEPRYRRSAPLYTRLADLPAEVDIVVYTPTEIAEWSAVPQALVSIAVREGRLLYERAA